MEFQDRNVVVASPLGDLHVNITAGAFKVLWGEGVGPQEEDDLFTVNRALFEAIALRKAERGGAQGLIVIITDIDVEDELDADVTGH